MINQNELPSSKSLMKSTLLTVAAAAVILATVVLPAEYGYDPTGVGKALGLTEMGEIKKQLAIEAEKDRKKELDSQKKSSLLRLFAAFNPVSAAQAQAAQKEETFSFTLKPNEGIEYKLVMKKGAKATFKWESTENNINYDIHGEANDTTLSYRKGRGVKSDEGEITAAFDGTHGWFWRNRGTKPATITLKVTGDYAALKKL